MYSPYEPYDTIENVATAVFSDGADNRPVRNLEVTIIPAQAGEGDPSTENVRPITGWTAATISNVGHDDTAEYEVSFGDTGTVYRGRLNVTTGVLTITYKSITYKGAANEEWSIQGNAAVISRSDKSNATQPVYYMCNIFPVIASSSSAPADYAALVTGNANKNFYIVGMSNLSVTTAAEWKAFLAENNLQIYYYLDNPVTVQLTPTEVKTFLGDNSISADCGTIVTLTYQVDRKKYYGRFFKMNPGYILLNGGGIDLSSGSAQTITGAYQRAKTALDTGKPIQAFNCYYGEGNPLSPVPIFGGWQTDDYLILVGATLHITVYKNDSCVVIDVADNSAKSAENRIAETVENETLETENVKSSKRK